jgi:hypothetical protein
MRIAPVLALALVSLGCGRSDISEDLYLPGSDAAASTDGTGVGAGGALDGRGGALDVGSDVPQFGGSDGNSVDAPSFEDSPSKGLDATSDAPGSCENCGGCCQGTTCVEGESPDACGIYGAECVACPPGGSCFKGACAFPQPDCGPSNCAGCCMDANTCSYGIAVDACGFGGQECEGCGPGSLNPCVARPDGGGICQPVCGPESCRGCCDGTSCLLGQSEPSCGTQGETCTTCVEGESCILQGDGLGGSCQLPCSAATCAGCCSSDVCAVGSQDLACGVGGETCVDCTSNQLRCLSGVCHP